MRTEMDILKEIEYLDEQVLDERKWLAENLRVLPVETVRDSLDRIAVFESQAARLKWVMQ